MRGILALLCLGLTVFTSAARADIERFVQVAPGIFRGDQPDTIEDYQKLKDLGVRTIINLRHDDKAVRKEEKIVDAMGFGFMSFQMNPLAVPNDTKVQNILAALTDPALQPVFIHCKHGKDRTGMIIGLYRFHYEGWTQEEAWNEMVKYDFKKLFVNLSAYFYANTADRNFAFLFGY